MSDLGSRVLKLLLEKKMNEVSDDLGADLGCFDSEIRIGLLGQTGPSPNAVFLNKNSSNLPRIISPSSELRFRSLNTRFGVAREALSK